MNGTEPQKRRPFIDVLVDILVVPAAILLFFGAFSGFLHLWVVNDAGIDLTFSQTIPFLRSSLRPFAVGVAIFAVLLTSCRHYLSRRHAVMTGLGFVVAAGYGFVPASSSSSTLNRLKLISHPPSSSISIDYSDNRAKDNYPRCTSDYNSLGFRDTEFEKGLPDGTRVLLIGDSFIWGDGIPTNEQTLSAMLRQELNARRPGAFQVHQAAYPGIGLHGYSRFAAAMVGEYAPEVIIIGYLGEPDWDPFDAQHLMDIKGRSGPLSNPLLRYNVLQHVHEVAGWSRETLAVANRPNVLVHLADLQALAERHRIAIVMLRFFGQGPDPMIRPPLQSVWLPEQLRYQKKRTPLWYALDCHPRPPLNRMMAQGLAAALLEGERGTFQEASFDRVLRSLSAGVR